MKTLVSLFITFLTVAIAFLNTAMASFSVENMEMTHYTVQQNILTSEKKCCSGLPKSCEDQAHECCISPLHDSGIISNIHSTSEKKESKKGKIYNTSFLALIQKDQEKNYIEKLNSPPILEKVGSIEYFYITLVGSIKSNC